MSTPTNPQETTTEKKTVISDEFEKKIDHALNPPENEISTDKETKKNNQNEEKELPIPEHINKDYNEINGKFFLKNSPDTLAFVDKGQKLQARLTHTKIAKSMVDIAEKRQWTEIKVTGTKDFRRDVWLEASIKGLSVTGYKPSEADLAELKQKSSNKVNEIENQPVKTVVHTSATGKFEDINNLNGKLIEHGKDHFMHKPDQSMSYFATLELKNGEKNKVWGVDLERAIKESNVKIGQNVELNPTRTAVTITKEIYDTNGNKALKTFDTHKNIWEVKAEALKKADHSSEDVIKEHPDLVNEVAAIKIAKKYSQAKLPDQETRQKFLNEIKDMLVKDVERGQTFKTVKIKEERQIEKTNEKEDIEHER